MGTQFDVKPITSLKSLVEKGLTEIPDAYIHPENERPTATPIYWESIPVIDLQGLHGPNRPHVVNAIVKACQDWGFFQVINHGIRDGVIEKMVEAHHRFFELSEVEKANFITEDHRKPAMYGTSFTSKTEKVLNWRDFLTLIVPTTIDPHTVECWPQVIRDAVLEYTAEVKKLALNLLSALSESLGVPDTLQNMLSFGRLMLNYYPPCPNPDMAFGLCGHSDTSLLTILLQDDVGGLQVSHQGRWVAVQPIPNAFVINIADMLQVLSNGRFQSVEHRSVPNGSRVRISIPFFCSPENSTVIRPIPEIINENNPAKYRTFTYGDYMANFYKKPLAGKVDNLAFASLSYAD